MPCSLAELSELCLMAVLQLSTYRGDVATLSAPEIRRAQRPDEGIHVSNERKSSHTEAKERQVVVSIRFPAQLLQRIHAVASVEETTANAVIREGMDHYIRERVRTDTFQEASRAYVERAQAHVATALMDPPPEQEPDRQPDRESEREPARESEQE